MANYGSAALKIELTDSGATSRDISNLVRTINGIDVEAVIEQSHAFGDAWEESVYTGFAKSAAVTLGGLYDDVANGPDALWSRGATRVLKFTWNNLTGAGKTTSVSVIMQKYTRSPVVEKAHAFTMILQPTGAVSET